MPEGDLAGRPGIGLLERDLDVVAQVAAAGRTVAALLVPAARRAEEHVEDVAEALAAERAEAPGVAARPGVAEAIVVGPLLGVREHFVGFVDLLEVRLGRRLVVGDVGMVLARQLPVCALDRALIRIARDAEHRVIIRRHG